MSGREGHIARLRAQVGSELLLVPSVSVLLWRMDRLLLAHHRAAGVWSTPGGAVEPGETLSAACRREAREELGISVEPVSVAAVIGPDEVRYPNGDRTAYVTTAFACRADGTPVADELELDQLMWAAEDDIPQLAIAPWLQPWVASLITWRECDPAMFS
jgi:8-oxo-dGTP pyrophosphatase MutT (NUDIX family)